MQLNIFSCGCPLCVREACERCLRETLGWRWVIHLQAMASRIKKIQTEANTVRNRASPADACAASFTTPLSLFPHLGKTFSAQSNHHLTHLPAAATAGCHRTRQIMAPLLHFQGERDRIRLVLSLMRRYKPLFQLPSRIRQFARQGDVPRALREWQSARRIVGEGDSEALHKLVEEGQREARRFVSYRSPFSLLCAFFLPPRSISVSLLRIRFRFFSSLLDIKMSPSVFLINPCLYPQMERLADGLASVIESPDTLTDAAEFSLRQLADLKTALEGKADLNELLERFFAARSNRLEAAMDAAEAELEEEVTAAADKAARRQEVTKRITSATPYPGVMHARTGSGDLDRMLSDQDPESWLQRSSVLSPVRGGTDGRARAGRRGSDSSLIPKGAAVGLGSISENAGAGRAGEEIMADLQLGYAERAPPPVCSPVVRLHLLQANTSVATLLRVWSAVVASSITDAAQFALRRFLRRVCAAVVQTLPELIRVADSLGGSPDVDRPRLDSKLHAALREGAERFASVSRAALTTVVESGAIGSHTRLALAEVGAVTRRLADSDAPKFVLELVEGARVSGVKLMVARIAAKMSEEATAAAALPGEDLASPVELAAAAMMLSGAGATGTAAAAATAAPELRVSQRPLQLAAALSRGMTQVATVAAENGDVGASAAARTSQVFFGCFVEYAEALRAEVRSARAHLAPLTLATQPNVEKTPLLPSDFLSSFPALGCLTLTLILSPAAHLSLAAPLRAGGPAGRGGGVRQRAFGARVGEPQHVHPQRLRLRQDVGAAGCADGWTCQCWTPFHPIQRTHSPCLAWRSPHLNTHPTHPLLNTFPHFPSPTPPPPPHSHLLPRSRSALRPLRGALARRPRRGRALRRARPAGARGVPFARVRVQDGEQAAADGGALLRGGRHHVAPRPEGGGGPRRRGGAGVRTAASLIPLCTLCTLRSRWSCTLRELFWPQLDCAFSNLSCCSVVAAR